MKNVLNILVWLFLFIGIFILLGFVSREKKTLQCKGLEINIDRSDNNYFILEEDVKELFLNMGYRADSIPASSIDTRKIEKQVGNFPSARKADVYMTVAGKVKIDIRQRKPVLRVFNKEGGSFYIDEEGWLMPLSEKFTSRVLVANGNIDGTYSGRYKSSVAGTEGNDILRDLFMLTKYINGSEFWSAQITQLYVNAAHEIELIPRVGNHTILFGDIKDMAEKFEKLMVFYTKGLKKVGWNSYSQINLKYKNQVVCKKNQETNN